MVSNSDDSHNQNGDAIRDSKRGIHGLNGIVLYVVIDGVRMRGHTQSHY